MKKRIIKLAKNILKKTKISPTLKLSLIGNGKCTLVSKNVRIQMIMTEDLLVIVDLCVNKIRFMALYVLTLCRMNVRISLISSKCALILLNRYVLTGSYLLLLLL